MWQQFKQLSLSTQILLGLLAGAVLGWLLAQFVAAVPAAKDVVEGYVLATMLVLKTLFINALKMVVVPLVLVSLICGTSHLSDPADLGRIGGRSLALYLLSTAVAISLALTVASMFNPGLGITMSGTAFGGATPPPLTEVLGNLVASNPIQALASGNMLQIIVFAILFGIAVARSGEAGIRVGKIFADINEVVLKLVTIIMHAAPLGVFAIMTMLLYDVGFNAIAKLAVYFVLVIFCLILHVLITYPAMLHFFAGLSPFMLLRKMRPAVLFAFSTSSSAATIPVTMEVARKRLGVGTTTASFSLPMGATINMDGTAIMQGVATVFVANMAGVDLHLSQYVTIVLMATLASVGTAAVPSAGLVMLTMVLNQVNLPAEAIGMLLGIDRILDMARTAVNVTGDATVATIVAYSNDDLDLDVYNNPEAGAEFESEE